MESASRRYPVLEILDHLFLTYFFLASSLEQQLPLSSQEREYFVFQKTLHFCVLLTDEGARTLFNVRDWIPRHDTCVVPVIAIGKLTSNP